MKKQILIIVLFLQGNLCWPAGQGMGHDASGGYTDEEYDITQEYIHDGKVQEAKEAGIDKLVKEYISQGMSEEEARAKAESIVAGSTEEYKALDLVPLELISQLYTMVIGVLPSSFTTKVAYTDQEVGKAVSAIDKEQAKLVTDNAADVEAGKQYLGKDGKYDIAEIEKAGGTEEQISKAEEYNKLADQKTTAEGTETVTDESQTEKETQDYCKLIAMAGEAITAFQAQMDQENIVNAPKQEGNEQVEALYAARQSHVDEAENCQQKHQIWGATTACYGVMMATSGVWALTPAGALANTDQLLTVTAKLGASLALSLFYLDAKDMHEKNAAKLDTIIAQLPNKGDCNPVSQRNCYCSQETTKNDAKYCAPQMHQRQIAQNSIRTSCVNNKMEADPKCSCAATNSCYQTTFMNMLATSGYGNEFNQAALDAMKSVTGGSISSGNYADGSSSSNAARKRLLDKANLAMRYTGSLTKDQKKNANLLAGKGIPASISSILASYPQTSSVKSNATRFRSGFATTGSKRYGGSSYGKKDNKVLYFGAKNNSRRSRSSSRSSGKKLAYKRSAKTSANKVLQFAEKAARSSQINKDSDRAIFEIISRRYQVSGWRELKSEE